MNVDIFAEWLQRQGQTIYRSDHSVWAIHGPRVLQSIPYHWVIRPSEKELSELLLRTRTVGLRYSTPIDAKVGQISYHVIYDKKRMEFDSLAKKVRHDVRNGLDYASIEPITFSRMATEGWGLSAETLQRQGRTGTETQKAWEQLCMSAEGLPGFTAWGAIHDQQLVAAALVFTMENCASILYQRSGTAHMKYGVNNALAYVVTNEALCQPGVTRIFYGLHSLDAPASVDEFKFRMGYIAYPVRQRVVFNPLIAPLFSSLSHRMVRYLLARRPQSHFLAKAEGLLRFYLQGSRSLADQDWPPNIRNQRSSLLEEASSTTS